MKFNTRKGSGWSQGAPKIRKGSQWVPIDKTSSDRDNTVEFDRKGFTWDQTHVDTQWLFDADATDNITVEKVTSLDNSGPGTLAAALDSAESNDNTLVVFEVGGVLDWEKNGNWLRPSADNVYVAGETAPYPGVTMIRGGVRLEGSNNIWRHMTFLNGNDVANVDNARCWVFDDSGDNNILDHCSIGWSPETNISHRHSHEALAVINSINAEALNDSDHHEAPHGYGVHYSGEIDDGTEQTGLSYMGNLQAHNWKRNPRMKDDELFFANVYTYNWGSQYFHSGSYDPQIDVINSVSEPGVDTYSPSNRGIFKHTFTVYFDGFENKSDHNIVEDGYDDRVTFVNEPMNKPPGLDLDDLVPASQLEDFLKPMVGPRPADRDPWSQRVIDDWDNREGRIIDYETDVGGYPDYPLTRRTLDPSSTDVLGWLQQYTDEVEMGV